MPIYTKTELIERATALQRQLLSDPQYTGDGWFPDGELICHGWLGEHGDFAWRLRYTFGFESAEIVPLLHGGKLHRERTDMKFIYVGGVIVFFEPKPFPLQVNELLVNYDDRTLGQLRAIMPATRQDWHGIYMIMVWECPGARARLLGSVDRWREEVEAGRNRWKEQQTRGGNPPAALLNPGSDRRDITRAWPC